MRTAVNPDPGIGPTPTLSVPPLLGKALYMAAIAKTGWDLVKASASHWKADKAQRLGAALAYYAVLALPPILVIFIFIVSLFYDPRTANAQVSQQVKSVMGEGGGSFMQTMMSNPQIHGKGLVATS